MMLVRATINYTADGERIFRDHVYDVDPSVPRVQHALRATWIVPLPASEQPDLDTTDLGLEGSQGGSPSPAPEPPPR